MSVTSRHTLDPPITSFNKYLGQNNMIVSDLNKSQKSEDTIDPQNTGNDHKTLKFNCSFNQPENLKKLQSLTANKLNSKNLRREKEPSGLRKKPILLKSLQNPDKLVAFDLYEED